MDNLERYLEIMFMLLGVFSAVARMTPNKADNRMLDQIWSVINRLGLRGGPTD